MSEARQRRFTAFDRLTPEGKGVVMDGFAGGLTQDQIQTALAKETQESISNGSLGRLLKHWRLQQEQERKSAANAERMVRALKDNDLEATEFATSFIQLGLLAQQGEIEGVAPETLLRLQRDFSELKIKQAELELKSRRVDASERELALKEKQVEMQQRKLDRIAEQAAEIEKAAEAGGEMSAELLKKIRGVYGLAAEAA